MNASTSICSPGLAAGPSQPMLTGLEPSPPANARNGSPRVLNASGKRPAIATLKGSRPNSIEEPGCFQGLRHASRPVLPASAEARAMTAGSGRKLYPCVRSSSPIGSVLKILLGSTEWASTESFLNWKGSATKCRRSVFQLVPSIRHRTGIGFGFWGTQTLPMGGRDRRSGDRKDELLMPGMLRKLWPTARHTDHKQSHQKDSHGLSVPEALRRSLWPTAQHRDQKGVSQRFCNGDVSGILPNARKLSLWRSPGNNTTGGADANRATGQTGHCVMLKDQIAASVGKITNGSSLPVSFTVLQLAFTSWLMNVPLSYLRNFVPNSSAPSETQSSGKSRRKSSPP